VTSENANRRLDSSGGCPLEYAVLHANVAAVKELLDKGAEPRLCSGYPDRFYDALLGSTCMSNDKRAFELLSLFQRADIQPTDPQRLLQRSADRRCPSGVRLAVEKGAKVNGRDDTGRTALHYAVADASEVAIATVKALVDLGADPTIADSQGETVIAKANKLRAAGNWPLMEAALLPTIGEGRPR
jgi:ankyrin repeat protein